MASNSAEAGLFKFVDAAGCLFVVEHRRIHGGAKGARAPHGSRAQTVKSACFRHFLNLISSFSTP